jgi:hypothetical protein
MTKDIRRFIGKALLLLPIGAVFVFFPTAVLVKAGEMAKLDDVIAEQADTSRPLLFGKAYNGKMGYYTLHAVLHRSPEVISLGSSRIMAVRSKFFKPEVSFYNAGGGAVDIHHFRQFLERIPVKKTPQILIVQLDQTYFNASWTAPADLQENSFYADADLQNLWMSALKKVVDDYRLKKYSLTDIFGQQPSGLKKIGLSAIAQNVGTLNDGSHYYGEYLRNPEGDPDYNFQLSLRKIDENREFFLQGDSVSESSMKELGLFLQECQRRHIHVVGFLAPFAHKVYQTMIDSGKYRYMSELGENISRIFKAHQFSFFDFSDLAWVGASDEETFDGYHGSEKAYVRLFLKMTEKDPVLASMIDSGYLQQRLAQTSNPYVVFNVNEF